MTAPVLVFAPEYNSPGKSDATGAFRPEARRFAQLMGGRLVHVDNRKVHGERGEVVLDEIARHSAGPWRTIAFFCHGTPHDIQLGFKRATVRELAKYIAKTSERDVRVLLYCCSTASTIRTLLGKAVGGDGGFADLLRDALCEQGATHCRVVAHDTVGHTTKNPYVRFFDGAGSPIGGAGGTQVVRPSSKLWTPWREALNGQFMAGDFRFRFPYLEIGQIHEALMSGVLPEPVTA
jgi:hypothetical protein